ncbi:hypothetical protein QR680_013270 [Steinernema hermaphroditum]|uniref:Uncharacterized protein n=1 Tax=Steinernema hermaphroditum TaxID=289476 RepID=A0AA39M198_9BILA|nr:hypothetical protein QR680_013270 [Steinernema hermaphroditum]
MILRVLLLTLGFAVFLSDAASRPFFRERIPQNAPNRRFAPQRFRVALFRREGPIGPPRPFRPRGDVRRAPQRFGPPARPFPAPRPFPPAPFAPPAPPSPPRGVHMPSIRPPPGVALKLNLAKHKDFMSLGAFLLQRFRSLMHRN